MRPIRNLLTLLTGLLCPAWLAADIGLLQADGSELQLDEPASRLITLSPNLAELVYAAGSGDRLVATVEYSDFPKEASDLPRVGDAFRLDIERMVSLRPDLVLAWHSGTPGVAVEQLRAFGIPVWSIEIRQPESIAETLKHIGRATGNGPPASLAADEFRQRLSRLKARYRNAEPLLYFYQVDQNPLFTINGQHIISQGLALCGGVNLFHREPALAFQVSRESVITANPAVLFAPSLPGDADPYVFWREWSNMRAVANRAMFTLDADRISRATPRWLDSIEHACSQLELLRNEPRGT